ncbi:unnamed protein product, partial [Notodromas monacha]
MKCVSLGVQKMFYSLGFKIGRYPAFFVGMSLLMCIMLQASMRSISFNAGQNEYVAPRNTESRKDEIVHNYFNSLQYKCQKDFTEPNTTMLAGKLMPDRVATMFNVLGVIVKAKDGGSVLRQKVFREINLIQQEILKVQIESLHRKWQYADVCLPMYPKCDEEK